jgi:lipid II isoglutaminyl synthase (glutamine-hydrolysing)
MAGALAAKLALARGVGAISRLRGGGGTSAPGKLLMRLAPDAIGELGARLARGSVLISATNGKTTTAAMAAGILERAGVALVHNQAGANMAGGIATTLLEAARPRGGIAGELGLFEVDELWLAQLARELRPRALLLGNLFRDQLDRYGELDTIAERWEQVLREGAGARARTRAGAGEGCADDAHERKLVLNADDPLVADIGRDQTGVLYFGVDDDSLALAGMAHAADAKHCRRCGAPYVFDAIYLGHLGRYHCESCGQSRPLPAVIATSVRLEGVRAARFTLSTPAGRAEVSLALPGLYNVYNALAAAALATALDVPLGTIAAGLSATRAAFGRAEAVTVSVPTLPADGARAARASVHPAGATRELLILLVKNPAGANEVLRTLALEPGEHDLLGVLNDQIADGRDVSWIWDADFELLAGRVRHATCSGTRAADLAARLKYAGVDPARIEVREDLADALRAAAANRPGHDAWAGVAQHGDRGDDAAAGAPLFALPTYTAMLALRELLVERGEASSAWS